MKLSSFHAIVSEVVKRRATPQPVFARYKLLEIERGSDTVGESPSRF
jgi:hypothetical protein